MSNVSTKLQVPMDKDVRDALEAKAKSLGFDSAQAYIRVWAKAVTEGRTVNFDEDAWGEPSDKAAARINRWSKELDKNIKAGKSKSFTSVEKFMKDLRS